MVAVKEPCYREHRNCGFGKATIGLFMSQANESKEFNRAPRLPRPRAFLLLREARAGRGFCPLT